ncbi:MAG: hypothetical protein AAGF85_20665 [Bacteroidota bacterium]
MSEEKGRIDGEGSLARVFNAYGVHVDTNGDIYIADESNSTIRKVIAR